MKTTQHNRLTTPLLAAAIMALGAAGPASAMTILSYDNDTEFLASGFSKVGGVNVRWGNNETNGDWEFSVVNGADDPKDEQQVRWNNHGVPELSVDFDENGIFADLGSTSGPIAQSSWQANLGGYNTVLFRAKATDRLDATDIMVNGNSLGGLIGDSDAQYVGISMDDFISGSLSLSFTADPGRGSDPGLQVKFGSLPPVSVPEPGTFGLLALGTAGLLAGARRRARNS